MDRVAIYVRVSTDKQSFQMQIDELTLFAKQRGWQVVKIFSDTASGTKENRVGLNNLMKFCGQRKADIVLTWKLDRFGRSLKHLVTTIHDLESLGVNFVSLKDNLDFTTPTGRFQAQILGAVAEFEASMIRMRVKAGLENARAKGKKLGRRVKISRPRVLKLFESGMSPGKIAKSLNCSRSGVRKILQDLK